HIRSITVFLVFLILLGPGIKPVFAHTSHFGPTPLSPFHEGTPSEKKSRPFYCPVHKHFSAMPCPHQYSKETGHGKKCKISQECGGQPFTALPSLSGFDHFCGLNESSCSLFRAGDSQTLATLLSGYEPPGSDPLKHPPKSI
ncbi:MAG: hypothetical protein ACE5E9_11530, partial [Nitrospinaceae bacterium]